MILKTIMLHPFSGIAKKTVSFERGLNVLLGPNEAGKSTVINALRMVLFTPTNYKKKTFENEISRFMPLGGGDTIRVSLGFEIDHGQYQLSRSWGNQRQSELKMPDRQITDPDEIQSILEGILGLGLHTFDTVVCASQSGLSSTVDDLSEDSQTVDQLTSIMRRLVLETDGVSVERLGELLELEEDNYLSHWDVALQCPERNRGIDDQWRQKVGNILRNYYQLESTKGRLDEIKDYYHKLADTDRQNAALSREVAELQKWVKTNEPLVTNLRDHTLFEETRKRLEAEKQPLASAVKEWSQLEADIKVKKDMPAEAKRRVKLLEDELAAAQQAKAVQEKTKKYGDAKVKKAELDEAKVKLSQMTQLTEEAYTKLTSSYHSLEQLKTKLEGGQLSLVMTARKPMDVSITRDLEPQESAHLESSPLKVTAGGKIAVDHAEWNMEVRSGIIDFDKLQKDFNEASMIHESTLKQLKVSSIEEAKKAYNSYQAQVRNVDILNAQLEQILAGDLYDELEKVAKSPQQAISVRPLEIISAELARETTSLEQLEKEVKTMSDSLAALAKEYGTYDRLMETYADKLGALKEVNLKLTKLNPIPPDIGEPKEFIELCESRKKALGDKQIEMTRWLIEKAKLEAQAPEESEADLTEQMRDAEAEFDQAKQKGNAIKEMCKVFGLIRQAADTEPLAPWLKSLGEILEPVTMGRFNAVSLTDNVPERAIRADGLEVPMGNLSGGTRVGMGLALRLSMADCFLKEEEGFVILDDPLVDMDPERQSAAAAILQNFAQHKQVVLVTCHPDNAKLIGGNTVNIEGPARPGEKTRSRKRKASK